MTKRGHVLQGMHVLNGFDRRSRSWTAASAIGIVWPVSVCYCAS